MNTLFSDRYILLNHRPFTIKVEPRDFARFRENAYREYSLLFQGDALDIGVCTYLLISIEYSSLYST